MGYSEIESAIDALTEACGRGSLRMSVPARLDEDHDILILNGLTWARKHIAELEAERDQLKAEVERRRAMIPVECCSGADPHCYGPRGCLVHAEKADTTPHDVLVAHITELESEWDALKAEVERLREVVRRTHANQCVSYYTDQGPHAPECPPSEIQEDTKP